MVKANIVLESSVHCLVHGLVHNPRSRFQIIMSRDLAQKSCVFCVSRVKKDQTERIQRRLDSHVTHARMQLSHRGLHAQASAAI